MATAGLVRALCREGRGGEVEPYLVELERAAGVNPDTRRSWPEEATALRAECGRGAGAD
jgi:hypothetical protein